MYKAVALMVVLTVMSGCATTKPNPVPLMQKPDKHLSCSGLMQEMDAAKKLIADSQQAAAVQRRKNGIYAGTGLFIIVPLFFMDFSGAADKEEQAAQARLDYLTGLYNANGCKV
jgi:hypothetical protein